MMWIVYHKEDLTIVSRCYSKKNAQWQYGWELQHPDTYGLALEKVDMLQFDKWKMWKLLQNDQLA
jgi:hypothetical protein